VIVGHIFFLLQFNRARQILIAIDAFATPRAPSLQVLILAEASRLDDVRVGRELIRTADAATEFKSMALGGREADLREPQARRAGPRTRYGVEMLVRQEAHFAEQLYG
jgi:hypothetical protein